MKQFNTKKLKNLSFTDKLAISGYIMLAVSLVGFKVYTVTGEQKNLFEPGYSSGASLQASQPSISTDTLPADTQVATSTNPQSVEPTRSQVTPSRKRIAIAQAVSSHDSHPSHPEATPPIEEPTQEPPTPTPEPSPEPPIIPIPPIDPPHEDPPHHDPLSPDDHEGDT